MSSLHLGTYRKLCYTFLPQIVSAILTKQSPGNHINVYSTNETKDCPISEKKRVRKNKGRLLRHKFGMRVSLFLHTTSVFKYLEPNLLTDVIVACQIRCHLRFKAKNKKKVWTIIKKRDKNVHHSVSAALIINMQRTESKKSESRNCEQKKIVLLLLTL